jgi:type I restriction enzyme S subunit
MKGVTERNRPDLPLLSVVREKGVILRDITEKGENHNFIPDDLSNYKVVREGQFDNEQDESMARIIWGSHDIMEFVSPAYFVFDIT